MLKSIFLLILAMSSIQFGASQAKQLFSVYGVAGTSALRLLFAGLMMAAAFKPWRGKLSKGVLLYGASLGLMNFSFYFALQKIPLGIAVALEFIGPLAVAIFSSRKKLEFLWILLAALGIYLLLPEMNSPQSLDLSGVALALLAGFFWALYIIFGKRASTELSGGLASSMGMLIAAGLVLPFGLVINGKELLNMSGLPAAFIVALFGSALPYALEMFALKSLPVRTFGVLMSMEPALAALSGVFFLSEHLSFVQWLAIACVIISSAGTTLTTSRK